MRAWPARAWLAPAAVLLAAGAVAASGSSAGASKHLSAPAVGPTAYTAAIGAAPGRSTLTLDLPLVADDAGLAAFVDAVSTPGSPQYGRYASVEQLNARFGARPGVAAAVQRFLRGHGARGVAFNAVGQYVSATMTVAAAQRTFATELARFRDSQGRAYIAPVGLAHGASAQPVLPSALRGRVTGVIGLDTQDVTTSNERPALTSHLPGPARLTGTGSGARAASAQTSSAYLGRTGSANGCSPARHTGSFTPNQYLTAYGYRRLHNSGLQGQGERVALIEIDGFRSSDISGFVRCFRLPFPHISVLPTGGLRHPLAPGGETTLDLELMTVAAPRLNHIFVYESKGSAGHVLHAYSDALARGRRPQVISISLGICEPLALDTMGRSGINGIERILRTAVGSGVSLLASAGDQGSSACVLEGHIQHRLAVSYPASSPYVTGVGGTNFVLDRANQIVAEPVWNDTNDAPDAGGGGASVLFGRPHFQDGLVTAVRIIPDVSMLADLAPGYAIFCTVRGAACGSGGWTGAGGTSAAAPLLAGGIALLDQDRRRHHHHELGDLNPLIYLIGNSAARTLAYHDVTFWNNDLGPFLPGSNHQPLGCCAAATGYDGASGWGSVNVANLAGLVH